MQRLFKKIIASPIAIAIVLATIVTVFTPPTPPPYILEARMQLVPPNRLYAYYDADTSLAYTSFLALSANSIELESINERVTTIENLKYKDYQAIYCPLTPPKRKNVFIDDIDNDNIKDILYVTSEHDSTFLESADISSPSIKSHYLLTSQGSVIRLLVHFITFYEDNVYFSIMIRTKNTDHKFNFKTILYSFNKKTQTVSEIHSTNYISKGVQIKGYKDYIILTPLSKQINQIQKLKLSTGECISLPYPKNIKFDYKKKNLEIYPHKYAIDYLFCHNDKSLMYIDSKALIEDNAVVFKHIKNYSYSSIKQRLAIKYIKDNKLFFVNTYSSNKRPSKLYVYDFESQKTKHIRLKRGIRIRSILYYGDWNYNGKKEIVFINDEKSNESFCVLEKGLLYNKLSTYPIERSRISVNNCVMTNNTLRVHNQGIDYILNYIKNPKAYKPWIWAGIFAAIIIFMGVFVQKLKEIRIYRKQQTDNKILQLQLENVQKRIDPHFIFNSLNNLGAMILEGKADESYDYLSQVSGVLYKALRNRSVLVTAEEELTFCTSILATQRIRFKNKFDYEVYIDKGLDINISTPSNILNSMTDNCIKHGFSGIDYPGLISIEMLERKHGMLIVVEDNGKGREAAIRDRNQKQSTGTGLDICYHYVKLLNRGRKSNFLSFKIIDLYKRGKASGTRCEFYIPYDLKLE